MLRKAAATVAAAAGAAVTEPVTIPGKPVRPVEGRCLLIPMQDSIARIAGCIGRPKTNIINKSASQYHLAWVPENSISNYHYFC